MAKPKPPKRQHVSIVTREVDLGYAAFMARHGLPVKRGRWTRREMSFAPEKREQGESDG